MMDIEKPFRNLGIMSSLKQSRYILDLSHNEKRDFLNSFDIIFCDCDGVIWKNMQEKIEDVGKGIRLLKSAGKKIVFTTNNSVRSSKDYLKMFKECDIELDFEDVIHPARTIIEYLKKINFQSLIYCIATETFKNTLKQAGYELIDGPNKILKESFSDLAKYIFDKAPVRAVIIDIDFNLSSVKLIRAAQYLNNPDCIFIGGAADKIIPFGETEIIGPGPYLDIVQQATGREAIILGKPGGKLGEMLIKQFDIKKPSRVLMIGDNLDTDIGFGSKCGFQTMSVLTGATTIKQLIDYNKKQGNPYYYANSLADFITFFEGFHN